ncbi:LPS export ABC transporter permease LptF [Temperatibacter marinus]|uniref:LPS export ABC transporter permease LptF n=1 Tax=Temperatibacter marinus TaxID=1456591 RepID=A0AA52EGI1_9PROT|nr:LPS export ABC transporter permease LptF [Temperatibacter marinus]WND01904.1 LPS export ABC transporter permease LptF [Temperatibacter marinus]
MITKLDRYILRQVFTPLMMTLAVAALLLLLEKMLRLFDFVVNQGGPVEVVFEMLANLTPHYLGLALPIGLFLGIIIAFRKISLSSELDAITSSGIGLLRLVRPLMMLAVLLMSVNIALTGWIQPHSRYAYSDLVFNLRSGALGASIKVGEFVEIGSMTLRIEESRNAGAELFGIFLEKNNADQTIIATAERGGFFATSNENTIILRLFNGVLVDMNEKQNKPRVLNFQQQDLAIKLPSAEPFRMRGGAELEQTLPELWMNSGDTTLSEEDRNSSRGNLHWRLMHNLTFLILPFLAIPMGISNKRTGKGSGVVIGLALLIIYNEVMEGMETAISSAGMSPFLTVWVLFSAFALLSIVLFRISAYKVGGDPLLWVDKAWQAVKTPLAKGMKKIMRIRG